MKTFLLLIIVVLLGVIAWLLYEDRQRRPFEQAADGVGDAIENVGKKIEAKAKEIGRSIERP